MAVLEDDYDYGRVLVTNRDIGAAWALALLVPVLVATCSLALDDDARDVAANPPLVCSAPRCVSAAAEICRGAGELTNVGARAEEGGGEPVAELPVAATVPGDPPAGPAINDPVPCRSPPGAARCRCPGGAVGSEPDHRRRDAST